MRRLVNCLLWPLTLALSVLLVGSPHGSEQTRMAESNQRRGVAEEVRADNEAKLLAIPGVAAVGTGLTEQGDRSAIHVYVDLNETDGRIPAAIPREIENVPVRVITTDDIKAR